MPFATKLHQSYSFSFMLCRIHHLYSVSRRRFKGAFQKNEEHSILQSFSVFLWLRSVQRCRFHFLRTVGALRSDISHDIRSGARDSILARCHSPNHLCAVARPVTVPSTSPRMPVHWPHSPVDGQVAFKQANSNPLGSCSCRASVLGALIVRTELSRPAVQTVLKIGHSQRSDEIDDLQSFFYQISVTKAWRTLVVAAWTLRRSGSHNATGVGQAGIVCELIETQVCFGRYGECKLVLQPRTSAGDQWL